MSRSRHALLIVLLLVTVASCARRSRRTAEVRAEPVDTVVRVAVGINANAARASSTSLLAIVNGSSGAVLATTRAGVEWTAAPVDSDAIQLTRERGAPVVVRRAPVILRADEASGMIMYEGRRFRGHLTLLRQGDRLLVVNNLALEDYIKGVVPLEIGTRRAQESEAVAAQAVSARSFTYARLAQHRRDTLRFYDLVADVTDQAYAGFESEVALATQQVELTRGLVIKYRGRIIEAVYSSSCGGTTADAAEVWPFGGQPYLKSVSDSMPGGGGAYCQISPRFTWSTSLTGANLVAGLDTYLRNYVAVNGRVTWVDSVTAKSRSVSGRISAVTVKSNTGTYEVTGDRIRFVFRATGGEILRSTLFNFSVVHESGAGIVSFEARGRGYGHGVGMCQWGAIGRARQGQNFREILSTYFPGTVIEPAGNAGGREDSSRR
jgi:stage II sporulation protein D